MPSKWTDISSKIFHQNYEGLLCHNTADITISSYLDDNVLINYDTINEGTKKGILTAELFHDLGCTINISKSVVQPVHTIEHLGFILDSVGMRVAMAGGK